MTDKVYIGSSENLNKRKIQHFSNLKKKRHTNRYLQSSYNKYGKKNFKFEIIKFVENKKKLIFYEQKFIDLTFSFNRNFGYNLCEIADRPTKGKKISKKHKEAISIRNSGRNSYWFGKKFSKEHRKKLCESRSNQIMTNNKPIKQYSLKGKFIRNWNSALEIHRELGYTASLINHCCHGKRNKHKGFKWKFRYKKHRN